MTPIVIRLAGEPKGKGRPRFVRATGRAFTPAATRSYEAMLRYAAQEAMQGRAPLEGPLVVAIHAGMPMAASWSGKKRALALSGLLRPTSRPDLDNLMKCTDALNEVVWKDDRQIVDARVIKTYAEIPELRIEVEELARVAAVAAAGRAGRPGAHTGAADGGGDGLMGALRERMEGAA